LFQNGKRFIAYDLVNRLQHNTEIKEGKLHSVFETSFDWKECRTEKFIQQKLDYIHFNPCKAKLVELPEQYEHSSAKYYCMREQGIYAATNFMELRDIDFSGITTFDDSRFTFHDPPQNSQQRSHRNDSHTSARKHIRSNTIHTAL
jgi:hypothetical protein